MLTQPHMQNKRQLSIKGNLIQNQQSKLVISLKDSAKCLKIRNLPVGTNHSDLKRVLQQMGNCRVNSLKVFDLPSGSSYAEVFASMADLKTLHKKFNHAEVDGRRILTEIDTQPEL